MAAVSDDKVKCVMRRFGHYVAGSHSNLLCTRLGEQTKAQTAVSLIMPVSFCRRSLYFFSWVGGNINVGLSPDSTSTS